MVHLGSNRGVSSHQMNPFCVLSSGPPSEDHGSEAFVTSRHSSIEALLRLLPAVFRQLAHGGGAEPNGFRPRERRWRPQRIAICGRVDANSLCNLETEGGKRRKNIFKAT